MRKGKKWKVFVAICLCIALVGGTAYYAGGKDYLKSKADTYGEEKGASNSRSGILSFLTNLIGGGSGGDKLSENGLGSLSGLLGNGAISKILDLVSGGKTGMVKGLINTAMNWINSMQGVQSKRQDIVVSDVRKIRNANGTNEYEVAYTDKEGKTPYGYAVLGYDKKTKGFIVNESCVRKGQKDLYSTLIGDKKDKGLRKTFGGNASFDKSGFDSLTDFDTDTGSSDFNFGDDIFKNGMDYGLGVDGDTDGYGFDYKGGFGKDIYGGGGCNKGGGFGKGGTGDYDSSGGCNGGGCGGYDSIFDLFGGDMGDIFGNYDFGDTSDFGNGIDYDCDDGTGDYAFGDDTSDGGYGDGAFDFGGGDFFGGGGCDGGGFGKGGTGGTGGGGCDGGGSFGGEDSYGGGGCDGGGSFGGGGSDFGGSDGGFGGGGSDFGDLDGGSDGGFGGGGGDYDDYGGGGGSSVADIFEKGDTSGALMLKKYEQKPELLDSLESEQQIGEYACAVQATTQCAYMDGMTDYQNELKSTYDKLWKYSNTQESGESGRGGIKYGGTIMSDMANAYVKFGKEKGKSVSYSGMESNPNPQWVAKQVQANRSIIFGYATAADSMAGHCISFLGVKGASRNDNNYNYIVVYDSWTSSPKLVNYSAHQFSYQEAAAFDVK